MQIVVVERDRHAKAVVSVMRYVPGDGGHPPPPATAEAARARREIQ
jgi:hypothetical protein